MGNFIMRRNDRRYRKKPVVIEAVLWTGDNFPKIKKFVGGPAIFDERLGLLIFTLEGRMTADIGDWIIKGVKGECYPCKPEIFEITYDLEPQP